MDQDQTFANIRSLLADNSLLGVRIYQFDSDLRLKALRVADSGTFVRDGLWLLKNVRTTELLPEGARVTRADEWNWKTVLKPSILTVYQVAPEKLEMTSLYDNINVLGSNQQKTSRFEIALWNKIFYPAAVLVMMVLALPFAYFQRRAGGVGFRPRTILDSSSSCWALFSYLGIINDWPPLFSARSRSPHHHRRRHHALRPNGAARARTGSKNPARADLLLGAARFARHGRSAAGSGCHDRVAGDPRVANCACLRWRTGVILADATLTPGWTCVPRWRTMMLAEMFSPP